MAGQRGLNRRLRGKCIPYFPDHDDIRILADDMFESVFERQSDLRIDRTLRHALDDILDRIFRSNDACVRSIQVVHGGI